MKTLLVTGGAGFIGSAFIKHELKKRTDYKIINLDNLTYCGNLENLKDVQDNPNYEFVKGNIVDKNLVSKLIKKADFVIFNPYLSPKAVPVHNPVSTLVYSSSMQNIESVAVDGKFLMKDGKVTVIPDEVKVLKKGQQIAESLCERGNITNRREGHSWKR